MPKLMNKGGSCSVLQLSRAKNSENNVLVQSEQHKMLEIVN